MRELPVRKNTRLKDYDYSQNGAYFITICVKNRHEMLGEIVGAGSTRPHTELSVYGDIVQRAIIAIPEKYQHITVNHFVVMPNHIHCIIILQASGRVDPAPTLGQMVGFLKYQTTKDIGIRSFWQRSYHDHIVRNEEEYQKIWQYIDTNPLKMGR